MKAIGTPEGASLRGLGASHDTEIARQTDFGELVPAIGGLVLWLYLIATQGWLFAAEACWILLLAVALGGWTLLVRLGFNESCIQISLGPWIWRRADLTKLRSVSYRRTGGWRSKGTLYVTDTSGTRVAIYVGRFARTAEWSSILLKAAATTGAKVEAAARHMLQAEADSGSG